MAVYTKLERKEVEQVLLSYRLTLKNFHKIKTGILNTNYYIECIQGRFILRVFEGGRNFEEENQELNFLLELKEILPCCTPLKTISGNNYVDYNGKMIALFYFIEGEPIKTINKKLLKEIGKYLGELHNFSKGKQLIRKSRIDIESYYNKINFDFIPISSTEKLKIKSIYEEIKKYDFSSLPHGIIHNDIFPDNVFIKDGDIVGILDFNESQSAPFVYDLAIVINFWIRLNKFPQKSEEEYVKFFLDEYEKYRKLEEQEKKALDLAIKKMALTFILLRLDKFINENLLGVFIEEKSYIQLLPLLKYY